MTVNIPKDRNHPRDQNPLDPFSSLLPSHKVETAHQKNTTQNKESQDVLKDGAESLNNLSIMSLETSAPSITTPSYPNISKTETLRLWLDAIRYYRDQLGFSAAANLDSRKNLNLLAASQAIELSQIMDEKQAALAQIQNQIAADLHQLEGYLKQMEELAQLQQKEIDKINNGNEEEKQAYADLMQAYNQYLEDMQNIGASKLSNGQFLIPEEPQECVEQYNTITSQYREAVATFNNFCHNRSTALNSYNRGVSLYNQKVAELNKAVNDFMELNNLKDYCLKSGIAIPELTPASKADISNYQNTIEAPQLISEPSTISIPSLPSYVKSIAQAGPSPLPKLPPLPPFDLNLIYHEMYNTLYETTIVPIDQAMMQYNTFSPFIIRQKIEGIIDETSTENALNFKILLKKLVSHQSLDQRAREIEASEIEADLFTKQIEGLNDRGTEVILGKLLLNEILTQSKIKSTAGLNLVKKETLINQLVRKLLLLSIGLLANQSMQALFPSLGMIAGCLPTLPKDSPAFAILFSISLCNRIMEGIAHAMNSTSIDTYVNSVSGLKEISSEDTKKIEAALMLGQLLVAGHLVEESLGLKGLLAHTLSASPIALDLNQLHETAKKEDLESLLALEQATKKHFIENGYPEDKAAFFAQIRAEFSEKGLLSPSVTGLISDQTTDMVSLKKSVKAALALSSNYSLEQAQTLAKKAVSMAFDSNSNPSAKQMRSNLQSSLKRLEVKNSSEIANMAIFTPATKTAIGEESHLIRAEDKEHSSGTLLLPSQTLSQSQIGAIIEKRVFDLLSLQVGEQITKQISQEILKTLFGTDHTGSNDTKTPSSPYNVAQLTADSVDQLIHDNDEKWIEALSKTFTESFKTVTSFAQFSKKLQDPAYRYVLASSIIYQSAGDKQIVNIPT